MAEAERLSERIGIIDAGRIVVEDTPDRLKALVAADNGGTATMEDVFMTFTGKSLDEDIDEDEKDEDEED
jgi:ABC-type multidrug transport system ATPase subunit